MRIYLILILIMIVGLAFVGCGNSEKDSSVELIDISKNIKSTDIPVSKVANYIEYIPLETKIESLIKKVRYFEVTDSLILVYQNYEGKILLFARDGTFLREISGRGKGPGEHFYPQKVTFSKNKQLVLIHSYDHIDKFSLDNQFIGSYEIGFNSTSVVDLGSKYLMVFDNGTSFSNDHDL